MARSSEGEWRQKKAQLLTILTSSSNMAWHGTFIQCGISSSVKTIWLRRGEAMRCCVEPLRPTKRWPACQTCPQTWWSWVWSGGQTDSNFWVRWRVHWTAHATLLSWRDRRLRVLLEESRYVGGNLSSITNVRGLTWLFLRLKQQASP